MTGCVKAEAAARHTAIAGRPPRLDPLPVEQITPDLAHLVQRMAMLNDRLGSREAELLTDVVPADGSAVALQHLLPALARLPEIIRTMLRHPTLFARQTDLGIELLANGRLPARERELAILRVAWLCGAPYEWGEHVLIGRKAGLTTAEIERIIIGSGDPGWSADDRAILKAVEELRADAMISDETWALLASRFDDAQLIELPILIGQYQAVAYSQNTLRLRLHAGNDGLHAR